MINEKDKYLWAKIFDVNDIEMAVNGGDFLCNVYQTACKLTDNSEYNCLNRSVRFKFLAKEFIVHFEYNSKNEYKPHIISLCHVTEPSCDHELYVLEEIKR